MKLREILIEGDVVNFSSFKQKKMADLSKNQNNSPSKNSQQGTGSVSGYPVSWDYVDSKKLITFEAKVGRLFLPFLKETARAASTIRRFKGRLSDIVTAFYNDSVDDNEKQKIKEILIPYLKKGNDIWMKLKSEFQNGDTDGDFFDDAMSHYLGSNSEVDAFWQLYRWFIQNQK